MRRSFRTRWAAVCLAGLLGPGCFDGKEATEGLRCLEDDHCAGGLRCVAGICGDASECDESGGQCGDQPSQSSGLGQLSIGDGGNGGTGLDDGNGSCVQAGQDCINDPCCSGTCVDYGNGTRTCSDACGAGSECPSCCCVQLADAAAGNVCVDISNCGQEAQLCIPDTCASAGSACQSDADCCDAALGAGAVCINNSGGWNSCFKTCTMPSDCNSGCCVFNAGRAVSICEANC